jgi:hypothetical protein
MAIKRTAKRRTMKGGSGSHLSNPFKNKSHLRHSNKLSMIGSPQKGRILSRHYQFSNEKRGVRLSSSLNNLHRLHESNTNMSPENIKANHNKKVEKFQKQIQDAYQQSLTNYNHEQYYKLESEHVNNPAFIEARNKVLELERRKENEAYLEAQARARHNNLLAAYTKKYGTHM